MRREHSGKVPRGHPLRRLLRFLTSRRGLITVALIAAGAVIAKFYSTVGTAIFKTFGFGVILLLLGLLIIAWVIWHRRLLRLLRMLRVRRWNRWLGGLLLILAGFGFLAFFQPAGLGEVTAGGTLGKIIIGSTDAAGGARLAGFIIVGIAFIVPRHTWRFLRISMKMAALLLAGSWRYSITFARWLTRSYRHHPLHRLVATAIASWIRQRRRPAAAPMAEVKRVEAITIPAEEAPEITPVTSEVAPPEEKAPEPLPPLEAPEPTVSLPTWQLPPLELLEEAPELELSQADIERRARLIEEALASYGVEAKVVQVNPGPAVTQFALEPGWDRKYRQVVEKDANGRVKLDQDGNPVTRLEEVAKTRVKVERITSLANDLALALAAPSIRIEAPVPGKGVVGIEVPNFRAGLVTLRSCINSPSYQKLSAKSKLALALGRGSAGEAMAADLAKMPHLLIAGATGSGKTVCLDAIISCLLMYNTPEEVRFLLIDPKRVELVAFNRVPHLIVPVVVDIEEAVRALKRVTREMDSRYSKLAASGERNIESYNEAAAERLPYLIVIIDELADLMLSNPEVVEPLLCRLAQLSRATGIHLIVSTQRPSVDVITGLIKANFPTRISFAVTSHTDSRTILDTGGAEKLLGEGDMLYLPPDAAKPQRLKGAFISDGEIKALVDHWAIRAAPQYSDEASRTFASLEVDEGAAADSLLEKARSLARQHSRISTSFLQRRLHIGYPRAARLMDLLEEEGLVGRGEPGRSREVISPEAEEDES